MDGRGGEFGTVPHRFIHFRLCSSLQIRKTTARSNLHTDTNHAGKVEGQLESLMHHSFHVSSGFYQEFRLVQTAL